MLSLPFFLPPFFRVEDLPPRKRESYLAWKDAGGTEGAVEVEIKKAAPVLG